VSYDVVIEAIKLLEWRRHPSLFFKEVWKHRGWRPTIDQAKFLEDMADDSNKFVLICSACGVGKTLTLATLSLWFTTVYARVENSPQQVMIASGSKKQSDVMYNYIIEMINNNAWIRELLAQEPTKTKTLFKDGSWIMPSPASEKFIWGEHPNVMIIDEAVLTKDIILIDAVFRIAPQRHCRLIVCSTPYDYMSFFVDLWMNEEKYPQFRRYHWSSKNAYWISQDIVDFMKTLPEDEYRIRWLGIPTPSFSSYFPLNQLKACRIMDEQEIENELRGEGEFYMGVDWGWQHPTAIVVVKRKGKSLVVVYAEQRSRLSGDEAIEWVRQVAKDYMVNEIYCDSEARWEVMRLQNLGLPAVPIKFHTEKKPMLSNLRSLINTQSLKIPSNMQDLLTQLARYNPNRKKDDDLVDALMLACRCNLMYDAHVSQLVFVSRRLKRRS